jgi:hypothetical protein
VFSKDNISNLTKEDLTSFLYFKNKTITRPDFTKRDYMLQKIWSSYVLLLDENIPISERFTQSVNMVRFFGKAIATGILTIVYPNQYGVWNNTAEAELRKLGTWPVFERGESIGNKYQKLMQFSRQLRVD